MWFLTAGGGLRSAIRIKEFGLDLVGFRGRVRGTRSMWIIQDKGTPRRGPAFARTFF